MSIASARRDGKAKAGEARAEAKRLRAEVQALRDDLHEALNCAEGGFIHPDDLARLRRVADGGGRG